MSKTATTKENNMTAYPSLTADATAAATEELNRQFWRPSEITDEIVREAARRTLHNFDVHGVTMTEGARLAVQSIVEEWNNLYRAQRVNY